VPDKSDISEQVDRLRRAAEEKQRRAPSGADEAGGSDLGGYGVEPARRENGAIQRRTAPRWRFQLAIRDDRRLTSTQKLVALIYALHAHKDGTRAYPGAPPSRTAAHSGKAR
jgi:hypothetical protein